MLERASAAQFPSRFQTVNVLTPPLFTAPLTSYPYFSYIFWIDRDGTQTLKLTADAQGTPRRSVKDTEYFRRAKEAFESRSDNGLFDTPRADGSAGSHRYWLEPLRSPSTDEFLAVMAIPAEPSPVARGGKTAAPVVAKVMAARLESLSQPVLPRGYGFAIVDGDGQVKFHSNPAHNLSEDFAKETQSDRALVALLRQHGGASCRRRTWGGRRPSASRRCARLAAPAGRC